MRVLVVQTLLATPHTETELEIAILHRLSKDEVFLLPLYEISGSQFLRTPVNGKPEGARDDGAWTQFITSITRQIGAEIIKPSSADWEVPPQIYDDVIEFADTFIRVNPKLCLSDCPEVFRLRLIDDMVRSFKALSCILKHYEPDLVYVFSGRFPLSYMVWLSVQLYKVDCRFLERGADPRGYLCAHKPISYIESSNQLFSAWAAGRDRTLSRLSAACYYEGSRRGVSGNFRGFSVIADNGRDDDPFLNSLSKFVVFFCTTEGEYDIPEADIFFGGEDQLHYIKMCVECCKSIGVPLIIKCHPNSPHDDRKYAEFSDDKAVFCLPSDSSISAMEIGRRATHRFSVGSSVCFQLMYDGFDCAFFGRGFGYGLGGMNFIRRKADLRGYISSPRPMLQTIPDFVYLWGDYQMNFGEPYRFFNPVGFHAGELSLDRLIL